MIQPTSSFPEYRDEGLTLDSREHLLGALDYGKQAHEALLRADRRTVLIKIDMLIALAHEARKPLLDTATPATPAKPDEPSLL
jgi:hypothetical protein